jgi:hypothetical protein
VRKLCGRFHAAPLTRYAIEGVGPENPSQPQTSSLTPVSLRCSPLIVMMQPTHFWHFQGQTIVRPLDQPRSRTIHG